MSRPLPSGDPVRLGPFRLSARLLETSAGIVFLGEDERGRQATVAVLRRGAASDPAARDRFRAAILAALPGNESGEGAPVVAAQPEGPEPWVAVRYEPDTAGGARPAGAERFLEPVALSGAVRRWRRGPGFVPYWAGGGGPAVSQAPVPAPVVPRGPERRLAAAVLALAVLLGLLAALMLMLFACRPQVPAPPPDPPPDSMSSSPPPTPSPTPSPSTSSPPVTPTPSPGESGGTGGPGGDL